MKAGSKKVMTPSGCKLGIDEGNRTQGREVRRKAERTMAPKEGSSLSTNNRICVYRKQAGSLEKKDEAKQGGGSLGS